MFVHLRPSIIVEGLLAITVAERPNFAGGILPEIGRQRRVGPRECPDLFAIGHHLEFGLGDRQLAAADGFEVTLRSVLSRKRRHANPVAGFNAPQNDFIESRRERHEREFVISFPSLVAGAVVSGKREEMQVIVMGRKFQHGTGREFDPIFRFRPQRVGFDESAPLEPGLNHTVILEFDDINPTAITEILVREILHHPCLPGLQCEFVAFKRLLDPGRGRLAEVIFRIVACNG